MAALTDVLELSRGRPCVTPEGRAGWSPHVYDARVVEVNHAAGRLVLGHAADVELDVLAVRVGLYVVGTVAPCGVEGDGVVGLGGDAALALEEGHLCERGAGGEGANLTAWLCVDLGGGGWWVLVGDHHVRG